MIPWWYSSTVKFTASAARNPSQPHLLALYWAANIAGAAQHHDDAEHETSVINLTLIARGSSRRSVPPSQSISRNGCHVFPSVEKILLPAVYNADVS